jgi:hypothetical protein
MYDMARARAASGAARAARPRVDCRRRKCGQRAGYPECGPCTSGLFFRGVHDWTDGALEPYQYHVSGSRSDGFRLCIKFLVLRMHVFEYIHLYSNVRNAHARCVGWEAACGA